MEMFNIYILALAALQNIASSNELSYYQIAGIHGMPFQTWDAVQQCSTCASDGWGGYCTHNDDLFPLWHRPYVALFEVKIRECATNSNERIRTDMDAATSPIAGCNHCQSIRRRSPSRLCGCSKRFASSLLGLGNESHHTGRE